MDDLVGNSTWRHIHLETQMSTLVESDVSSELEFITEHSLDTPWSTIVWNDPVNLMSYVSRVFRTYFHYSREHAHTLMLQVHHDGRSAVATGPREEMERHAEAMHERGLWATVARADA